MTTIIPNQVWPEFYYRMNIYDIYEGELYTEGKNCDKQQYY